MAKQARSLSKFIWLTIWLSTPGCRQQTTSIPATYVSVDRTGWQHREGRLWLNGTHFSGWQYGLWASGDTAFVGAFSEGKAEGIHRHWYADGRRKEIRRYRNGWQEGRQQGWFADGKAAFVYHFRNDVYHGNRKEWLPDGRLVFDGNYHNGQEDGPQRQWFADGSLKANYVARKGRNYGFTGVKNCVNVADSISVIP